MTENDLYLVVREVVILATGLLPEKVIKADQNKPAPSDSYATIKVKRSVAQRGQANIIRSNSLGNKVAVGIKAQIIAECSINFYRSNSFDYAERLDQCNKRPDISAFLFSNSVGWNRTSASNDLTSLQSDNVEQRAQKSIYLMYETSDSAEINNILSVSYEVDGIIDDEVEILASASVGIPL